jgi:hypothetical protein
MPGEPPLHCRLQWLISCFWRGREIGAEVDNLKAVATDARTRALVQLIQGQLLASVRRVGALAHLDAGFAQAAHLLTPKSISWCSSATRACAPCPGMTAWRCRRGWHPAAGSRGDPPAARRTGGTAAGYRRQAPGHPGMSGFCVPMDHGESLRRAVVKEGRRQTHDRSFSDRDCLFLAQILPLFRRGHTRQWLRQRHRSGLYWFKQLFFGVLA